MKHTNRALSRGSILLLSTATSLFILIAGVQGEESESRHFTAKQIFDYDSVVLFNTDLQRDGWDRLNLSIDGRYRLPKGEPDRLAVVTAPLAGETVTALRFNVPRAPNTYRSEVSLPSENGFNERWYGVSLLVPKDWEIDSNPGADIVIQWHAVPGNSRPTYPNLAIAIQDSNWWVKQSFGSPQKGPTRSKLKLEKPLRRGEWISWIINAKWSPTDEGRIRIWKSGELVADLVGPNTYGTIGKDYTPYLKTGIYHPEWNLKTEERRNRYNAEKSPVAGKEIYISNLVVARADATYEQLADLVAPENREQIDR